MVTVALRWFRFAVVTANRLRRVSFSSGCHLGSHVTNLLQWSVGGASVRVDLVMTSDDFSRPSLALRHSLTAETTRPESDKLDARSQRRRSSLADTTALRRSSTFPAESVGDDDAGGA